MWLIFLSVIKLFYLLNFLKSTSTSDTLDIQLLPVIQSELQ